MVRLIALLLLLLPAAPAAGSVLVDGALAAPGPVPPAASVVVTNGRVRVSRVTSSEQRAGMFFEVRDDDGDRWLPVTSTWYGDWTYVNTTVVTAPTAIDVLDEGAGVSAVRWTFGDHRTGPKGDITRYAYPFTKTVRVFSGQSGYFTHVRPLTTLPPDGYYAGPGVSEHEVGFGIVAGSSVITSNGVQTVISTPPGPGVLPATELAFLVRAGDQVVRTLVPLPRAELFVPCWSAGACGGFFVYRRTPGEYGAYLHAALAGECAP